jgi:hypothetical protein
MINRLADAMMSAKTEQHSDLSARRMLANSCWLFGNSGVAPTGCWFRVSAMHDGKAAMLVFE